MVKISDAADMAFHTLKDAVPNPRAEAEMLVSFVLKKTRLELVIHKNDTVSDDEIAKIQSLALQRKLGKPMAYITGTKEFMSLDFIVNESVLIPRPETEELVDLIIELFEDKDIRLLDLCTGSGAICCSAAYYLKNASCTGVDISSEAIATAKKNAEKFGIAQKTDFAVADVLGEIRFKEKFDVVVSNPPYIESETIDTLDTTVKDFEPLIALDGGKDGLIFYRKIIRDIRLYLKSGGMLLFEIGYNQGDALKNMLRDDFSDIKIIKDLSGHDRIACAVLS